MPSSPVGTRSTTLALAEHSSSHALALDLAKRLSLNVLALDLARNSSPLAHRLFFRHNAAPTHHTIVTPAIQGAQGTVASLLIRPSSKSRLEKGISRG